MTTNMVSSLILTQRKGGFNDEELLKKLVWLYNEIHARQGLMGI